MSTPLSPSVAAALRQSAEAAPRLATNGLSSPGDVAGRFAAMLASLRDGAPDALLGQDATAAASQPAGAAAHSASGGIGEHRVALAAVSLLLQDLGNDGAAVDETPAPPLRRREAAADVSSQVVAQTVATGAPADGRWMATLMATDQTGAAEIAA